MSVCKVMVVVVMCVSMKCLAFVVIVQWDLCSTSLMDETALLVQIAPSTKGTFLVTVFLATKTSLEVVSTALVRLNLSVYRSVSF